MKHELAVGSILAVSVLVGGCNDNPGLPGAGVVEGGSASKRIGLDGGVLTVGGTTLVVPKDAVTESTKFSLKTRKIDDSLPRAAELVGYVVEVEPSGTNFARYATLHMLFFDILPEGQTAQLVWLNGDTWEPVEESRLNENGLTGSVSHLTTFGALAIDAPPRSTCGNGIVEFGEGCDDGVNDGSYGGCNADCTRGGFCGDGAVNGPEGCDDGVFAGGYDGCNRDCTRASFCGDGNLDAPQEACDDGVNDGAYGGCAADCSFAGFCGDGNVDMPDESCDDGVNDGSLGGCSPTCQGGAVCGDGVVAIFYEQCDDGVFSGVYGGCNSDCTFAGFCGDGTTQSPMELCDDANIAVNDGCAPGCVSELLTVRVTPPNSRLVSFEWDSALYDGTAVSCDLEIDSTNVGTVPCSNDMATVSIEPLSLPAQWGQLLDFEVIPDVVSTAPGVRTVAERLRCEAVATNDIANWNLDPTPDVDEDCDGNFDNVIAQLKQTNTTVADCSTTFEDTNNFGGGFFIDRVVLGFSPDGATCKAACDDEIKQMVLEGAQSDYDAVENCIWQNNECHLTRTTDTSVADNCSLQQRWTLPQLGPTYF